MPRVNDHLLTSSKHLHPKFVLNNNQRSKLEHLPRPPDGHPLETHNPGQTLWGCTHLVSELNTSTWVPAHNGVVSTSWVPDTDSCFLLPYQTTLETSRALQQVQSTRLPPKVTKKVCTKIPGAIFSNQSQGRDLVQGHCTGTVECGVPVRARKWVCLH